MKPPTRLSRHCTYVASVATSSFNTMSRPAVVVGIFSLRRNGVTPCSAAVLLTAAVADPCAPWRWSMDRTAARAEKAGPRSFSTSTARGERSCWPVCVCVCSMQCVSMDDMDGVWLLGANPMHTCLPLSWAAPATCCCCCCCFACGTTAAVCCRVTPSLSSQSSLAVCQGATPHNE